MTNVVSLVAMIAAQTEPEAASTLHADTNVELVMGILMFVGAGFALAFGGLTLGRFVRPTVPHPEKAAAYECGEPAIGGGWVQFDLRVYTIALVFIVFDVEIALLWPWAVAFKGSDMMGAAFAAFAVFFALIAIPFAYEISSGYLDWVRASSGQRRTTVLDTKPELEPSSLGAAEPAVSVAVGGS